MRFLGPLAGLVDRRRIGEIIRPEFFLDELDGLLLGGRGDIHGIRAHVGNQTHAPLLAKLNTFIEPLGDAHRVCGGESDAGVRFLLQLARRVGRLGLAAFLGLVDSGDLKRKIYQLLLDRFGGLEVHQNGFFGPDPVEPRKEDFILRLFGGKTRVERPVFLRNELPDLAFAVHNKTERHGLHPSRTEPLANLLPEKRTKLIADNPVQDASGLLRVHEVDVDITGMFERAQYGLLRDLMEFDALYPEVLVRFAENIRQMPADGLPLPVRVGRKIHGDFARGGGLEVFGRLDILRRNDVLGREIVREVHTHPALGKVPDVAHGGFNLVILAEEFIDGPGFGGRFDDDEMSRARYPGGFLLFT
ncbi:MAG: hypothetical protein BWY49_01200 [Candidatus Omnitrophica bacterium ADurb.Bin314]|nr:MAG: hypothetical protein BWY49_01200 [Candidatus Omnitrophica bacterium ADurb.Bin314]